MWTVWTQMKKDRKNIIVSVRVKKFRPGSLLKPMYGLFRHFIPKGHISFHKVRMCQEIKIWIWVTVTQGFKKKTREDFPPTVDPTSCTLSSAATRRAVLYTPYSLHPGYSGPKYLNNPLMDCHESLYSAVCGARRMNPHDFDDDPLTPPVAAPWRRRLWFWEDWPAPHRMRWGHFFFYALAWLSIIIIRSKFQFGFWPHYKEFTVEFTSNTCMLKICQ